MRKLLGLIVLIVLLMSLPAQAMESKKETGPWEKYSLRMGTFISTISSNLRVGTRNIGLEFNLEDILEMSKEETVFRVGGSWRFSQNRKHRIDLDWFAFHRDASRTVIQSLTIEDNNGDSLLITPGTRVDTFLNLDVYRLCYSYSFIQDDRIDLAAEFGLFVMPIEGGLAAEGLISFKETADFIAPLPTIGVRADIALTDKWFLRLGTGVFYLEYENFSGSLVNTRAAIEYNPWRHVGFGLGFDAMRLKLEAEDEDYPAIDFNGKIGFEYTGVQLYMKIRY